MITPNSIVHFLSVKIDSTQKNQIYFSSRAAQYSYFYNKRVITYDLVTFVKKDNVISLNANIDDLWNVNYIMYRNKSFTDRWFYAFITKMEWASDNTTYVYVETDPFQTWFLDCQLLKSFVVREHSLTDDPGDNVVAESLELGEYVQNGSKVYAGLGEFDTILMVTQSSEAVPADGEFVANQFVKAYFYGIKGTATPSFIADYLDALETAGKTDSIIAIYTAPNKFTKFGTTGSLGTPSTQFEDKISLTTVPDMPLTVDGYSPRNGKLLTFPYSYLYAHNNNGQGIAYAWEHFDGDPEFDVIGAPLPNGSYKLYPANYEIGNGVGNDEEFEMALTLSNFPLGSYTYDAYKEWVATKGLQNAMAIAGGAISTIAGAATGNALMAGGGIAAVSSALLQRNAASVQPPVSRGNINSADANFSQGLNDFILYPKSIRYEYAEIIDEFFDMFGYATNRLKVPNVTGRGCWNYVKTIDVNITGPVPVDDMQKLKAVFDNGVTFWHDGDKVADYSQDNTVAWG